ncbi:MAG: 2'-deoxycytidine 5'-triphosphate deaminase [Nanoarchaeota archaeon]|nr:2'-deoxycytidine 5'-triphosphate deaminase [Nanoarchaeota archaeon]
MTATLAPPSGYCFNAEDIEAFFEQGNIQSPETAEQRKKARRIQPSSLDVTLSDDAFSIDTSRIGAFTPERGEEVYTTISRVPKSQRRRIDISNGFDIRPGFTYFVKINEKIKLPPGYFGTSSQKSSYGRLFLRTRLLADYNDCFDDFVNNYAPEQFLNFWLMIQPKVFSGIIHPGISINQLRIFQGPNPRLNTQELEDLCREQPILYDYQPDGTLNPTLHEFKENLIVHLDLEGRTSNGIFGLRARQNQEPIDFKQEGTYKIEDYFDILINTQGKQAYIIQQDEHWLLNSKEIIKVPAHLSGQTKRNSHLAFRGETEEAGFFDNKFEAQAVFEVSPQEPQFQLRHGMPVTEMQFFRNRTAPKTLYGKDNHYQGQLGPRISKHFEQPDLETLAKKHHKLARDVVVHNKDVLLRARQTTEEFAFFEGRVYHHLAELVQQGFLHQRYDCEEDEEVLQPIPYVIVMNQRGEVLSYVRASDINLYGDKRLFGKHSIGLGGHIEPGETIEQAAQRELQQELKTAGTTYQLQPQGTLYTRRVDVDKVHLGIIYVLPIRGTAAPNFSEGSAKAGKMVSIATLQHDTNGLYESWSNILIPHLETIYQRVKTVF